MAIVTIISRAPRERSATVTEQADAEGTGPYTVHVDCILTRRKRHHIIENAQGGVAFRSRWFSDIIEWLVSRGEHSYNLETNRNRFGTAVTNVERIRREE